MQLKQISVRKQDGKYDTHVHLVDKIRNDTATDEFTNLNLGSTSNGGLKKLINLSNSINHFFLESSLGRQRDGIIGCCSYGLVYTISETLDKLGVNNMSSRETEMDKEPDSLLEILPSLLSVLMDSDLNTDLTLAELSRRIYIQHNLKLEAETIRKIVRLFNSNRLSIVLPVEESSNSMTHIFGIPTTIDINKVSVDHELMRQDFFFRTSRRLRNWAESDTIPGRVSENDLGVYRICFLANALKTSFVERAAIPWKKICRTLTELQSLRIKQGASIFALTTRPTSAQLKIFFKLDVSPPQFVRIESCPTEIEDSETEDDYQEEKTEFGIDTLFDSFDSYQTII